MVLKYTSSIGLKVNWVFLFTLLSITDMILRVLSTWKYMRVFADACTWTCQPVTCNKLDVSLTYACISDKLFMYLSMWSELYQSSLRICFTSSASAVMRTPPMLSIPKNDEASLSNSKGSHGHGSLSTFTVHGSFFVQWFIIEQKHCWYILRQHYGLQIHRTKIELLSAFYVYPFSLLSIIRLSFNLITIPPPSPPPSSMPWNCKNLLQQSEQCTM